MTRFDAIDADRAFADSQHLWLTCFMPDAELAQITREALDEDDELRERFLAATQKQFERYISTRSDL